MAKFTLFLIHGIGIHRDPSWADQAIERLSEAWQRSIKLNTPMQEHIEVVPICYDSAFEDYLDDFADLGKAVFSDALTLPDREREQLAATLVTNAVTHKHFLWSYLVDVVLYKMSIVKEQVNALVAKQLYQHISRHSTSDQFGIVAHSLGTRVINDTLQNIRTAATDKSNFYQQGYRIKFLMQISDVTDLFSLPLNHDQFPPCDVYPHYTYDYLRTITNCFDPIARMVPTRLQHWPEGLKQANHLGRPVYKDIVLDHVHETNVHGLTHYMLHPKITDEIFDLSGFKRLLTESDTRCSDFPALGPKVSLELRDALSQLIQHSHEHETDSWQTYVNLILKFGEVSHHHEESIA
ncbi:hypothetical protein [Arenicella xantha]|uniref:Alpha/beta hydrolase family protein DUF900 n=1 Tax=Arenicella xantha TaxID=644221 RepID=A0A395JHW6_9GAMM|nr:hypothetical protein [Arenicella xantha]RBP49676.1 hypothetical protein DFR28_103101 [Arenicella xantha]